jgi:hypothetical protein
MGAETQFWPSKDFAEGYRTWDLKGHAYDMLSRSSPIECISIWTTTTLSDMSDCLLIVVIS